MVVFAENAAGSPALVPVEFVVQPCAVVAIAPDVQLTDSLTRSDERLPTKASRGLGDVRYVDTLVGRPPVGILNGGCLATEVLQLLDRLDE